MERINRVQTATDCTTGWRKHAYSSPKLTIYGDAKELTLKRRNMQDHNQGNNNQGDYPIGS